MRVTLGVLGLCAFIATFGGPEAWTHDRVFFPDAWRMGRQAAAAEIRAGTPRLVGPVFDVSGPVGYVHLRAIAAVVEKRFGRTQVYRFDPATRLPVRPSFGFMPWSGELRSLEDLGAFARSHDERILAALRAGKLEAARAPEHPPSPAEIRERFAKATTTTHAPTKAGRTAFQGTRFLLCANALNRPEQSWSYSAEDTAIGALEPSRYLRLPPTQQARFLLDDDGITLFVHELETEQYWCIDLHQRGLIQGVLPEPKPVRARSDGVR